LPISKPLTTTIDIQISYFSGVRLSKSYFGIRRSEDLDEASQNISKCSKKISKMPSFFVKDLS
jgi:hypothetical protein